MPDFDYKCFGGLVSEGVANGSYEHLVADGVHRLCDCSNSIHFLCRDLKLAKELGVILVCFGGALKTRNNIIAPFFSGWNIGERLGVPTICISDPTLEDCETLLLSWFMGTPGKPSLPKTIAKHLDNISATFGAKLVMFGGSGGGFAIMNTKQHMRSVVDAVIWNPQTNVSNYIIRVVNDFAREACDCQVVLKDSKAAEAFLRASGLSFDVTRVNFTSGQVLYLQNTADNHVGLHMQPFMAHGKWTKIGENIFYSAERRVWIAKALWGKGHAILPKLSLIAALKSIIDDADPYLAFRAAERCFPKFI